MNRNHKTQIMTISSDYDYYDDKGNQRMEQKKKASQEAILQLFMCKKGMEQ